MDNRPTWRCPKCGSENVDHPRTYGPGMRFVGCNPMCMSCGHQGAMTSIEKAFEAWRVENGA